MQMSDLSIDTKIFKASAIDGTGLVEMTVSGLGTMQITELKSFQFQKVIVAFLKSGTDGKILFYKYSNTDILDSYTISTGSKFLETSTEYTGSFLEKAGSSYELLLASRLSDKIQVHELTGPTPASCHFNCTTCDSFDFRDGQCLACAADRTISGGDCPCNAGGVYDNGDGTCASATCDMKCDTCTGPLSSECGTCRNGYQHDGTTTCHCPGPAYNEPSGAGNGCSCSSGYSKLNGVEPCVQCDVACDSCLTSTTDCPTCSLPFVVGGSNTCVCPSG